MSKDKTTIPAVKMALYDGQKPESIINNALA